MFWNRVMAHKLIVYRSLARSWVADSWSKGEVTKLQQVKFYIVLWNHQDIFFWLCNILFCFFSSRLFLHICISKEKVLTYQVYLWQRILWCWMDRTPSFLEIFAQQLPFHQTEKKKMVKMNTYVHISVQ